MINGELIVDNFVEGGGASTGLDEGRTINMRSEEGCNENRKSEAEE